MNIRIIGEDNFVIKYFKNNRFILIILMITFAVGIFAGVIYYKNATSTEELSNYVEKFMNKINVEETKIYNVLKESLLKNTSIILIFWLLGASVIGIPILLFYVLYKGFSISFTISTIISTFGFVKGNVISIVMLFFQNVISTAVIFVAMSSAVKLAINILRRKKDMKIELLRHTIMCLLCMVGMVLASIVEAIANCKMLGMVLDRI